MTSLTKTEFGASSNEAGYATDLKTAGGETDQATYDGYLILQSLGYKYDANTEPTSPMTTTTASSLTVALLKCMKLGSNVTIPGTSTFDAALGVYGAFGVRGFTTGEPSLLSHDGTWILEPPTGSTWQSIISTSTGITDTRIATALLAYGVRANYTASSITNDVPVNPVVFDWATLPSAQFSSPVGGVVVGECKSTSSFMQHLPASAGGEVLGFVKPSCYLSGLTTREAPPSNFAERLLRLFGPSPAYATALYTTGSGGGKTSLSPYLLVDPGSVNLTFTVSPSTKSNKINATLQPAPEVESFTAGGAPFKQASVLMYLQAVANNGTPGQICHNWAYTDADGVATFGQVSITKAGGYQLYAQTVGTVTSPDGTLQPTPFVQPGTPDYSSAFQLKNDNSTPGVCPAFDGTYYYPDIVGNPTDKSAVFPPE